MPYINNNAYTLQQPPSILPQPDCGNKNFMFNIIFHHYLDFA